MKTKSKQQKQAGKRKPFSLMKRGSFQLAGFTKAKEKF